MKTLVFFAFLLCSAYCFSQNNYEIKGNVDTIKYSNFIGIDSSGIIIERKPKKNIFLTDDEVIFNQNNLPIKENHYLYDGTYDSKTINTYSGDKITGKTYYNKEGKLNWHKKYEYNKNNLLEKITKYDSDSINITRVFKYQYNKSGNKTKEEELMPDGSIFYFTKYEYDNNKLSKSTEFNDEKEKIREITFFYSKADSLIKKVEENFKTGNIYSYLYNSNGEEVEYSITSKQGDLVKIQKTIYDYDASNNWIKKAEVAGNNKGNIKLEIVKRTISYRK